MINGKKDRGTAISQKMIILINQHKLLETNLISVIQSAIMFAIGFFLWRMYRGWERNDPRQIFSIE